ncbi:FxsB family cyclophane-forming radical SAM/SPASM peptide maturase [Streptomyces sp. NPDC059786]|uniref:FxsB family cyclophane-forming radical SAM/SPASM peptide maturase n=1 Tax=Streptomyces sp. NPDC059786 TaxID=3346946 RepID=UPI00364E1C87
MPRGSGTGGPGTSGSGTSGPGTSGSGTSGPGAEGVVPFRQFLLKVHSRCNLDCDYCYVYHSPDQSWRRKPRSMAPATVGRVAGRIAEHARTHGLPDVRIILHGGEPLLLGPRRLDDLLGALTERLAPVVPPRFSVQTNGVLLDEELLDVLRRRSVRVSVSLDGSRRAHDRHRRSADGRGSHDRVTRGLRLLNSPSHKDLFAGLLCTVDLANDPLETYEALLSAAPPRLDLLLPHGTWETPPPGLAHRTVPPAAPPGPAATGAGGTPYADWLCRVFDRWFDAPVRETGIRLFEELMSGILGGTVRSESVGLAPVDLVVIETDGTIEQSDSLKTSYPGAPETGMDVLRHSFDEALRLPEFRARQSGAAALSDTCGRCRLAELCGGGLYAHRFDARNRFANPSVYCHDLAALIAHIRSRIEQALDAGPAGPATVPPGP